MAKPLYVFTSTCNGDRITFESRADLVSALIVDFGLTSPRHEIEGLVSRAVEGETVDLGAQCTLTYED